jgi:CheY-like chemotaxis protein
VEKFVAHERGLGRDDLMLPIYYVTTPLLEKPDLLKADSLASEINARERYDFREHADLPITEPQTKRAIRILSEKIATALSRTTAAPPMRLPRDETNREAAFERASKVIKNEERPADVKIDRKQVLWVDDRPGNNIHERSAMARYGIDFDLALSTSQALEQTRNNRFDAIVSDMSRPPDHRAGYTLLRALRERGDVTPFFIYAASDASRRLGEALSRGAQGSTNVAAVLITDLLKSIGLTS